MVQTFIVTLTSKELLVITQMLYMRALEPEQDPQLAQAALSSISLQTDLVKPSPEGHGVFDNEILAPPNAMKFHGRMYIPV